ncbi:hypothetical protein [Mesorhizobium australicum]|uniref:hypothetical protein n=1 Tax=Mesorhizobium australicum TaxID=536018 RepID=UPI0033366DE6
MYSIVFVVQALAGRVALISGSFAPCLNRFRFTIYFKMQLGVLSYPQIRARLLAIANKNRQACIRVCQKGGYHNALFIAL